MPIFGNHLNIADYQLQNAKLHITATAPTAAEGQIYYDSVTKLVTYHNGTTWISLKADALSPGDNISVLTNDAGYLTSYTETDPVFLAHVAAGITGTQITNWDLAVSWGNHALAGYLTSYSETDTLDTVTTRGAVTANNLTVGSLIISGNLTVNGTTTTVNTEEINLADNIITLNSNEIGVPSQNAGIVIERGTSNNRALIWNETTDTWQIQASDGIYYNILYGSTTEDNYAETIANTATVTHNLNTNDIEVRMYDTVTLEDVYADVVRASVNSITVTFYSTPANSIRVLVKRINT